MNAARGILPVCLTILASCATLQNPIYQSKAPETRGGRAIAATIDLVGEVQVSGPNRQQVVIGLFYAREVLPDGGTQAVLFSLRGARGLGRDRGGAIDDYDLRETYSLTVDQARRLVSAIDDFLATDPKSLPPTRMVSYEMDSGTADAKDRPLRDITLVVFFSVTHTGKSFKAAFGPSVANLYNLRPTGSQSFDLNEDQVRTLRDAVAAAVDRSAAP